MFVLQGNSPTEWGDSCFYDFDNTIDHEITPDVYFCKVVLDLNLNKHDIEKLGKELDWNNYVMQTANEFVDKWDYYQKNGIKETLYIYPSIGNREVLPPKMIAIIGFDYKSDDGIKRFEKTFAVSPLNNNRICNNDIENHRCFNEEIDPYSFEEPLQMSRDKQNAEYTGGGSGTSVFDISGFSVITIITGILFGIGSFFGLMIYWNKKKIKTR